LALPALQPTIHDLPTSFVTQYSAPADTTTRLMETILGNTSGATRTVTICFVEVGDIADEATPNANAIAKDFDLPPGLPVPLAFNTFFNAGDFISAKASGDGVVFIASGLEEAL